LREGDVMPLTASLLTLGLYTLVCLLLAYRVARRTALGLSGPQSARKSVRRAGTANAAESSGARTYAGWLLPFASPQLSAIVEKELRYAVRNAQLRVVALMAVGLTVAFRLAQSAEGRGLGTLSPQAEGAGSIFVVIYVFMLVSPLSTNLFGYEGAGMRALILSPVPRRLILFGKNLALLAASLLLAIMAVLVGVLISRELSTGALLFAGLAFCVYAPLFALFGNILSLRWPKRMEFGKQMNRSGVAGLLLLPFVLAMLGPPAAAIWAAHYFGVGSLRYVILGAFAAASLLLYWPILSRQGRALGRLELDILEAVAGRDGEGDQRITG
jgi:ABC-2 type transport system permease protein